MGKLKRISPRKEPVQQRSFELRAAILEAATYVLKKEGALGFTTNKVAEKAGVNIASFYQYYPNKESLLFHMVEMEWTTTFDAIFPILADETKSHRERLTVFIEKFYQTEAEESVLRHAMNSAGVAIENTIEYRSLQEKSDAVITAFFSEALKISNKTELRMKIEFIQNVVFSFSENRPADDWHDPLKNAGMMADMLCTYFNIS